MPPRRGPLAAPAPKLIGTQPLHYEVDQDRQRLARIPIVGIGIKTADRRLAAWPTVHMRDLLTGSVLKLGAQDEDLWPVHRQSKVRLLRPVPMPENADLVLAGE